MRQLINGGGTTADLDDSVRPVSDEHFIVPTVDLVTWMVSSFSKKDYVVVKMDVEGAEFPILKNLMAKGKLQF